jgi:hypothetical protein
MNLFILFYLFIKFCDVFTLAIIHKGDLAIFGYRPAMQVNFFMKVPFKILATCLNSVVEKMVIF